MKALGACLLERLRKKKKEEYIYGKNIVFSVLEGQGYTEEIEWCKLSSSLCTEVHF